MMKPLARRRFLQAAAAGVAATGTVGHWHVAAGAEGSKRIKAAQIGVAHAHASGKMAAMRALPDEYEVVGIAEPDEALRQKWRDNPAYRGLKWLSVDDLLATPGLRMVAVETAVKDLVPTADRCVRAGMHLHLDKPGGESLPAFRTMLEEAQRRRLTVQMGYMFRNNPAFQFCFEAVRKGWLGKIFSLDGLMSKWNAPAERGPMLPYAGGVMFELGCHLIDAMITLLGKPQRVAPFGFNLRSSDDDLLDNQLAVLEYPGTLATVRSTITEIEGGQRRQFVVCGELGTIDIRPLEPPKLRLALDRPRDSLRKGYQDVPMPKMVGRYDDQLRELAQVIRGERAHPYSIEHDLIVQETVLRAANRPTT